MNKKANLETTVIIFIAIIVIMGLAFAGSILATVVNNFVDDVTPIVRDIGTVGNTNFSQITDMTFVPVQTVTHSFNWLFGVLYAVGLLSTLILAIAYRNSAQGWMIPIFVILGIVLVSFSILMSNSYEEFLSGSDDVSTGLQSQTILSFLMIYSPLISMLIFFIAGIIMFTGAREDALA